MISSCTSQSLIDRLLLHAEQRGSDIAFTFLKSENEVETITYADLIDKAVTLGAEINKRTLPEDRVLLVYPFGIRFIEGFLGCLFAGAIAVPGFVPSSPSYAKRLSGIADDC